MSAIGILVALPDEGRTLLRRRLRFESLQPLKGGHWLAVSGAGPEAAQRHAEALVQQGVQGLVSWGCAAALHEHHTPGRLFLPERILGADGQNHRVNPAWHAAARSALELKHALATELLVESRTVVATARDKHRLHETTGAQAVDMESAALARVAGQHQLPFLVVRSIADSVHLDFPPALLKALNPRGDAQMTRLLGGLLRNPGTIPELMALGQSFSRAMATLTNAHSLLGEDLHFPDSSQTPS